MIHRLKDNFYAENKILKALPKMAKAAQLEELKEAFEKHLKETEEHVSRLEQAFELIEVTPRGKKCEAIEGNHRGRRRHHEGIQGHARA